MKSRFFIRLVFGFYINMYKNIGKTMVKLQLNFNKTMVKLQLNYN